MGYIVFWLPAWSPNTANGLPTIHSVLMSVSSMQTLFIQLLSLPAKTRYIARRWIQRDNFLSHCLCLWSIVKKRSLVVSSEWWPISLQFLRLRKRKLWLIRRFLQSHMRNDNNDSIWIKENAEVFTFRRCKWKLMVPFSVIQAGEALAISSSAQSLPV